MICVVRKKHTNILFYYGIALHCMCMMSDFKHSVCCKLVHVIITSLNVLMLNVHNIKSGCSLTSFVTVDDLLCILLAKSYDSKASLLYQDVIRFAQSVDMTECEVTDEEMICREIVSVATKS